MVAFADDFDFDDWKSRLSRREAIRFGAAAGWLALSQRLSKRQREYAAHQYHSGPLFLNPKRLDAVSDLRELIKETKAPQLTSQDGVFVSRGSMFSEDPGRKQLLERLGPMLGFEPLRWREQTNFFSHFLSFFYGRQPNQPAYIDFLSSRKPFGKRIAERGHKASQSCTTGGFIQGDTINMACGYRIDIEKITRRMALLDGSLRHKNRVGTTMTRRTFSSNDPFGVVYEDIALENHWCLSDSDHLPMLSEGKWPACGGGTIGDFYVRPMVGFCRVDRSGEVCRVTFDFIGSSAEVAVIHEATYPVEPAMRIGWRSAELIRELV